MGEQFKYTEEMTQRLSVLHSATGMNGMIVDGALIHLLNGLRDNRSKLRSERFDMNLRQQKQDEAFAKICNLEDSQTKLEEIIDQTYGMDKVEQLIKQAENFMNEKYPRPDSERGKNNDN